MGVLESVLEYKKQKEAEANAQWEAIPTAVNTFIAAKQAAQKSLLDELTTRATLQKLQLDSQRQPLELEKLRQDVDPNSPERLFKRQELALNEQKTMAQSGFAPVSKQELLQQTPRQRRATLGNRQEGVVTGKYFVKDPTLGKQVEIGQDENGNPIYASKSQAAYNKSLDTQTNKQFENLNNTLDWSKQVRSAYGVTAQGLHRAERLEGLVSRYKDMNLDTRETEELAIGLNSLLQGSNVSAQEQVKGLVPKSVIGNVQKFKEWLTNEPQGLQQQKFVERMMNDVRREKDVASAQLLRDARPKIAAFEHLEKADPSKWSDVLNSWGISPDAYKEWKKSGFKNDIDFSKIGKSNDIETLAKSKGVTVRFK